MALTVAELIVELNKLPTKDVRKYPIAYHTRSDAEFSVDSVEVDDNGNVIINIEDFDYAYN
jgi:hypothetical protein